jgi:hypothetical protein
MSVHEISKYKYYFHQGSETVMGNKKWVNVRKEIMLFEGQRWLCEIRFVEDPTKLYQVWEMSVGVIVMNLPTSYFPEIIDMLRNEKPVYLHSDRFPEDGGVERRYLYLTTSREPIGESEGTP